MDGAIWLLVLLMFGQFVPPVDQLRAENSGISVDPNWYDGSFIAFPAKNAAGQAIKVQMPDGSDVGYVTIAQIKNNGAPA